MKNFRIESVVIAVGIALLGVFVYLGLSAFGARDRVVTVRGLAEEEVKADHVIWPITYKTTGNDMQSIYADIHNANQRISDFLVQNGVAKADISVAAPQIVDLKAERYASSEDAQRDRYNVTNVITVSTTQVDKARSLMTRMGELLKQGIVISASDYGNTVQYEFTSLNKIKPRMIEDATKKARESAVKFANDSESKLGKIKSASQGLFTIEDRDAYTPWIKRIRVVTSVDYFLEN